MFVVFLLWVTKKEINVKGFIRETAHRRAALLVLVVCMEFPYAAIGFPPTHETSWTTAVSFDG